MKTAGTMLDAIGGTRLFALQHLVPQTSARILLKLEYENPTRSMKDRMALAMVEAAEQDLMELLADKPRAPRPPPATIVVATKLDKLGAAARKPALTQIAKDLGRPVIGFSAETGAGRDELWAHLQKRLFTEASSSNEPLRQG